MEKKDGTKRFCVDYRRLNAVMKLDVFPLPRIDDTLDLSANSAGVHFGVTILSATRKRLETPICLGVGSSEEVPYTFLHLKK